MSRSRLSISAELFRELIDLPDDININAARWNHVSDQLELIVSSKYEMEADITPTFAREYEGDVVRIRLTSVNGYDGPIEPRPSIRRALSA